MAVSLEKLVKALEAIKVLQPDVLPSEQQKKKDMSPPNKKDKIINCNIIADCMCSPALRNIGEFPKFLGIAMETFLMLCDDQESDVRMVADECLNRTIKTLLETNLGRIQLELYKEIKKNGAARSLRAALWRFADLCHLIRPQKCRPYVVNLLPCLGRICCRSEESIQETLITAMAKICPALMGFTNDLEIKVLLKAFLPNISSSSASARRTAASSLTLICQNCHKPQIFFAYLLHTLLDMLIPVNEDKDVYTLLGILLSLRHIIPYISTADQQLSDQHEHKAKDAAVQGQKGKEIEAKVGVEELIQVYELLLYYLNHPDHNVITASLEALQQLLKTTPAPLLDILLTQGSIQKSGIYEKDASHSMTGRTDSRAKLPSVSDDAALEDDVDRSSEVTAGSQVTDSGVITSESQTAASSTASETSKSAESKSVEDDDLVRLDVNELEADDALDADQSEGLEEAIGPMQASMTTDDDYTNIQIGDLSDDRAISQSSSVDTLSEVHNSPSLTKIRKGASVDCASVHSAADVLSEDLDTTESQQTVSMTNTLRPGDIGSFVGDDLPLLYCARLLCSKFLLSGYKHGVIPDHQIRVSIKALALGCTGSIVAIHPTILLEKLHKSSPVSGELQPLSDVLRYASHSDPQLKGYTAVLVGYLLWAVLHVSHGNMTRWLQQHSHTGASDVSLDDLTSLLMSLLDDESSVTSRQALVALKSCLMPILHSVHSQHGIKIVLKLLHLKDNPYWLVKVELLELLGDLDFKVISYLESVCDEIRKGSHHFMGRLRIQDHVTEDIFLTLLGDEDSRVRHASGAALVKLIPKLFYAVDHPQHDPVVAKAKHFVTEHLDPIMHDWSHPPQPLIHGLVKPYHYDMTKQCPAHIEAALSRIVADIIQTLIKSTSKHLTCGCCHALYLLSEEYLVTQYAAAWCCSPLNSSTGGSTGTKSRTSSSGKSRSYGTSTGSAGSVSSSGSAFGLDDAPPGSGAGSLALILALITSSPIAFDLTTHHNILRLAGNLFSGAAYRSLRKPSENLTSSDESRWIYISDRLLVPLADQLLLHVARLLNICAHIMEDQVPGPPQTKPALPSLPNAPSLSPIKRKAKGVKEEGTVTQPNSQTVDKPGSKTVKEPVKEAEKDKAKSKDALGTFYNIPHYMKLYETLKGAYSNYKISLDMNSCEKFSSLLSASLGVLAQLCEVAGILEIGKYAEEILGYLKSTVTMEDTTSILCVQQLLKALFGTNLASQWESTQTVGMTCKPGKATRLTSNIKPGLYHCCFTTPYTQFTQCLAGATFRSTTMVDQEDSFNLIQWLKKRAEKRVPAIMKPGSKADKASVGAYIRLFEPLVIKALKQYTISCSLQLQQQVLNLLAQLVQLRVNYCLLDSDQIFMGFVIKQFEFIEEGQIRNSGSLIPHIFYFLVLLSYERYHSKCVINMPKIIQLCDGLLASGLDPNTHVIPALQCIVHDLFVLRSVNKADAGKDLDTQREVVIAMLLKLIKHHQVLELFILVLYQCRKDGEDRWKRLSRQVTDTVLPLLATQEMNVDSQQAVDVVHRLFEFVAPSVFRPVDIILKSLFSPPPDLTSVTGLQRWLSQVLILLRVLINQSKEEMVLSRLQELELGVALFSDTSHKHHARKRAGTDSTTEPQEEKSISFSVPEETLARFLLQVIGVASSEICWRSSTLTCEVSSFKFLCQEVSHLLLYVTHMFQSGIYRKVATFAMGMIKHDPPPGFYSIHNISATFRTLAVLEPVLTLQWCNILILLNYENQHWWSEVLQTPQKYVLGSPSGENSLLETHTPNNHSIHLEIMRRGGLILFCDYVCENLNDAEHVTWVIINHVNDLIHLSLEPPVQDFISAIHRNSAASGLFIQAINLQCDHLSKPSLVKKTLHCLEGIHLSQSGALMTLLIDKFLHTHHLTVSRHCDSIACQRVEMLLAENFDDSRSQLPLEDLERLVQFMKTHGLTKRHARLASLLNQYRTMLCPESKLTLSPEKTHPLVIANSSLTEITIDTLWYVSIVRDQCFSPTAVPRECAQLLQNLDYTNILSIIMTKECNLAILDECISLGASRTLAAARQAKECMLAPPPVSGSVYPQNSPSREKNIDPLFQASQITLLRHINSLINLLPVPHQMMTYHDTGTDCREDQYREKMEDILNDITWMETTFQLTSALLQYLVSLPQFPWEPSLPAESTMDIARFCLLALELLHWMLKHDQYPTSAQMQTAFECFAVALQRPEIQTIFAQKEKSSWVCTAINTIHQFVRSLLVLPGSRLVILPNQDSQDDVTAVGFDDFHHVVHACDQISELIDCLKTHLSPQTSHRAIPHFLAPTLRNIIVGLARLPLVNSYARTPPLVWKMGWMPSPTGEMKTSLPPVPQEYLLEKDVLKEFIFRISVLGWTSRQQFEETWMSLLGVLNPIHLTEAQQLSVEEDIEWCQCAVLAMRSITCLLVQSSLVPHSGNPNNSTWEYQPRDKPMAFLHTKVGKKLMYVRGIIEQELLSLVRQQADTSTHHPYTQLSNLYQLHKHLYVGNADREWCVNEFGLGQMSIESLWSLLGMLSASNTTTQDWSSDSDTNSSAADEPSPQSVYPPPIKISTTQSLSQRSSVQSGLDIHSCLQFLLELFKQLLSPTANPKTSLIQLHETVKAVVVLSDLFTDKSQYEWMLETLLEVYRTHPMEDELVVQYIVVGVCKAAAITGLEVLTIERVVKLIEACMKSSHLPTKVCTLYGCLYLLETGMVEITSQVIPTLTDYLYKTLNSITHTTIHSQQHVLVMWAVVFYVMENYHDEISETDFTNKTLQLCISTVSSQDDVAPLPVYLVILRGLERLLLADVPTKLDAEQLVKLSVGRLCLPSPQRALAALGLMLTCMYSGKQNDQWTPTQLLEQPDFSIKDRVTEDPESLIVAMERVTVLFDRIRKGFPYEARVIARILPSFLADFFPPQDIMNKVIGEFLSNQQPHPQLMASVLFQVFEQLLDGNQIHLIQDWVMLSLSNFTQRSPLAMAVWSLTCFFISASTNKWLRALLPHTLERMGKMDAVDTKLFCIAALDFWNRLKDPAQKRAFVSTFKAVAKPDSPYAQLLASISV